MDDGQKLKEHPERGVYVRDLSMHTVHGVGECERMMERGCRNRAVGSTLMNKDSSRSHSIFTLHLEICRTGEQEKPRKNSAPEVFPFLRRNLTLF